ncbi:MAG: lantibiotic dehydratase [Pseudonocardiales bacterium]|nr:lantibiotic dehydratase [Pseudonocardiales bacterium]
MYRWTGAALLRASTDPGGLDLPEDLDLFGDDTAQRGLAWLSAMWRREDVRTALDHASPALSRRIDNMVALGSRDARQVRRVVISLASYVLRWQQRPTPFGLFAGVGLARIGAGATVRWGRAHRVAVRADAGWLGDVLARLHQCRELLERLSVVVNDAGTVRGVVNMNVGGESSEMAVSLMAVLYEEMEVVWPSGVALRGVASNRPEVR